MKSGCFYGIGVGPGDPELMTVKATRILAACGHVFTPRPETNNNSLALDIARQFIRQDAQIHLLTFPMTADAEVLSQQWSAAARSILDILEQGEDVCFLTLGDALLYSTYIYLLRELKIQAPDLEVTTVPGVNSFSAAAALTDFSLGEGKENLCIVPTADALGAVRQALSGGGTVVLMKVGRRLPAILRLLDEEHLLEHAVFVAHAGRPEQHVETDLRKLLGDDAKAGYLSVILVHCGKRS